MGHYLRHIHIRSTFSLHGGSLPSPYSYTINMLTTRWVVTFAIYIYDQHLTTRWVITSAIFIYDQHTHYTVGHYLRHIHIRSTYSLHGGSLPPPYSYTINILTTRWVVTSAIFIYDQHTHYTVGHYLRHIHIRSTFLLHGGSLPLPYSYTINILTTRWVITSAIFIYDQHSHYTVGRYLRHIHIRSTCSLHGGSLPPPYSYTINILTTRWVVTSAIYIYDQHAHYTVCCYLRHIHIRSTCSLHGGSLPLPYSYTINILTTRWVVTYVIFIYDQHAHFTMGHNRSPTFTTRWVTTGHTPSPHDGSQPVTHLHYTMGHNRSPTFTTRWVTTGHPPSLHYGTIIIYDHYVQYMVIHWVCYRDTTGTSVIVICHLSCIFGASLVGTVPAATARVYALCCPLWHRVNV